MNIQLSGTTTHLNGDWTLAGFTQNNIASMAVSLEQIGSRCEKRQQIDCKQIIKVDAMGLQFLSVWLQCLSFRGVEPELVNITDRLRKAFQSFGFWNCYSENPLKGRADKHRPDNAAMISRCPEDVLCQ